MSDEKLKGELQAIMQDSKAIAIALEGMDAQRAIPALCMALGLSIQHSVPPGRREAFIATRVPKLVSGSIDAIASIDRMIQKETSLQKVQESPDDDGGRMNDPDQIVQKFNAGDAVPEWLIYTDPNAQGATKPDVTFAAKGTLVLADGIYWILPSNGSADVMVDARNGDNVSMGAASKDVIIPCRNMIMSASREQKDG